MRPDRDRPDRTWSTVSHRPLTGSRGEARRPRWQPLCAVWEAGADGRVVVLTSGRSDPMSSKSMVLAVLAIVAVVTGVMVLLSLAWREPDEALLAMLTDIGSRIGQHLDYRRLETELGHQREVLYQSESSVPSGASWPASRTR